LQSHARLPTWRVSFDARRDAFTTQMNLKNDGQIAHVGVFAGDAAAPASSTVRIVRA